MFDRLKDGKLAEVIVKNKFEVGTDIEVMGKRPDQDFVQRVKEIYNQEMEPIEKANPGQRAYIIPDRPVEKYFMIRKKVQD